MYFGTYISKYHKATTILRGKHTLHFVHATPSFDAVRQIRSLKINLDF